MYLIDKKIVVSGYYGFDNYGDEGILSVLTKNLNSFCKEVTVISHNPRKTASQYHVKSVYTFNIYKLINALKSADVLISGGGSLLQDVTSLKSLIYYLFVIICALILKKKVIIFAQGIGPIKNFFFRFITKQVLKKCSYISVRDDKSLFLLRSWKLNPDKVNDPMWNADLPPYLPQNNVGIQLRGWKNLSDKFLKTLAQQVVANFPVSTIKIISFQDSIDYDICKKFQHYLVLFNPKQKVELLFDLSNEEISREIASLSYLIAMRYHACLIALKYGIRTMAINYDVKVETLANEAKIPCVELFGKTNFDDKFLQLKNLDMFHLESWAAKQHFNFEKINLIIQK